MSRFITGVLIGRFNPPHIGHIELIKDAISKCDMLFLIIGSDLPTRTNQNIFFVDERIQMLNLCLEQNMLDKIRFISMQDYNNPLLWATTIKRLVEQHSDYIPDCTNKIKLFGFNKDASSFYLNLFPEYEFCIINNSYFDGLSSTTIRRKLCGKCYDYDYFCVDSDNSEIDYKNLHPKVCEWLENNFQVLSQTKINKNLCSFLEENIKFKH